MEVSVRFKDNDRSAKETITTSRADAEIVRKAATFRDPANNWRFAGRPDCQTPYAFAEANLECIGPDMVHCDKCGLNLSEWEPTDVPLTEHKKVVDCPFIRDLFKFDVRSNSNICRAMEQNLYTFDTMFKAVQDNPSLLNKTFDEFLCAMIRGTSDASAENIRWHNLLNVYPL